MSFATYARNRNAERLIALLSAVALMMSLMAIYATPAKAHHPTTTAEVVCVDDTDVAISYTSTSWQNGSGHGDIRIQVSVDGGDWNEVASGAYNSGNGYSFSGTFDAAPYVGHSIRVRSIAVGNWDSGAGAGNGHPAATTGSLNVVDDCTPPPPPPSGWACVDGDVVFIDDATNFNGTLYETEQEAENDPNCTPPPPPPSGWACVDGDVVFIDDATNFNGTLYETEQEAENDPNCTPPPPPPSGWACVDGDVVFIDDATNFTGTLYETREEAENDANCIPPPPTDVNAAITVTVDSTCAVVNGAGEGQIAVVISVDGGATVTVTDSSGAVVGTLTSDGTITVPAGATYTWVAVPSDGFEFPDGFVASGTLDIEDCTPPIEVLASITVSVSGSCELDGDEGEGFVDITLSVPNGATVVVRDSDGDVVGTVTDDATLSVPEGATYTWQATPSEGFEFPSGAATSGSVSIERCSDPDSLPFTGIDPLGMGLFAILLVGAGITAIYKAPREEGA